MLGDALDILWRLYDNIPYQSIIPFDYILKSFCVEIKILRVLMEYRKVAHQVQVGEETCETKIECSSNDSKNVNGKPWIILQNSM